MPGRPRKVPSYCLHKASGQAYVTLNSREHYLGKYGSQESHEKYARLIAEHCPYAQSALVTPPSAATIDELVLRFWTERVVTYYVRDGEPTERQFHIRLALRPLCDLYGSIPAAEFSPRKLKAVRDKIIRDARSKARNSTATT